MEELFKTETSHGTIVIWQVYRYPQPCQQTSSFQCEGGKYFLNVLFNDVENCQGYIVSGICEWIEVKQWRNDIENLSQCHLVHHTTHMEWAEFKAGRPRWQAGELTSEP